MFRISPAAQASDVRTSKATVEMLKSITEIGDRLELTAWEESYVMSTLLTAFLSRHVREENP